MVDHERKIVQGVTNGNTDVVTSATTTSGTTTTSAANSLINNGFLGFPCNTEFRCKITKSYPVLKFNGTGELTVVNPTLAQTAFSAISAIINNAGTGQAAIGIQISTLINALQTPGLQDQIPSAESIRRASDHVPMNVFGSRIFFFSRR
jgi:hypothetical protein